MLFCKICNKLIDNPRRKTTQFCSVSCSNKSRTTANQRKRNCLQCNEEFILNNIAYEKRGYGKYCSMKCSRFATKKYFLNESYFDNIDSAEKAYWLGFCFADAYNSSNELIFELSVKDRLHLDKLITSLEATQKIQEIKNKKYVKIRFGSRHLCQSLSKLGCIPNKSYTVQYPKIKPQFNNDFIRGVFDGDGCIYLRKNNSKTWNIYSESFEFISTIKNIIESELNISIKYERKNKSIATSKKDNIKKIYNYLYKNAKIFLLRKEVIFNK